MKAQKDNWYHILNMLWGRSKMNSYTTFVIDATIFEIGCSPLVSYIVKLSPKSQKICLWTETINIFWKISWIVKYWVDFLIFLLYHNYIDMVCYDTQATYIAHLCIKECWHQIETVHHKWSDLDRTDTSSALSCYGAVNCLIHVFSNNILNCDLTP